MRGCINEKLRHWDQDLAPMLDQPYIPFQKLTYFNVSNIYGHKNQGLSWWELCYPKNKISKCVHDYCWKRDPPLKKPELDSNTHEYLQVQSIYIIILNKMACVDGWLALHSVVVHSVGSSLKIFQSATPSPPYPLCPLSEPVPADSVPGVPIPRRRARCHPHWPGRGGRCKLGAQDKFMAGGRGLRNPCCWYVWH